ncbi:MAG: hypothetical protein ACP5NW_03400 [Candidatus Woesearchaeota archaeon]
MRMPPNPEFLFFELIFTLIALIFGLLIYYKTKESYELTKHPGIRYFRDAFLFLGLSYLLRFFFSVIFLSRIIIDAPIQKYFMMPIFMILLGYFSTIGLWCLILSSTWKQFKERKSYLIIGNIFAIAVSFISFITHSPAIMLYVQLTLVLFYIIATLISSSEKKKFTQIKIIYIFVALLWIINLLTAGRPMLPREFGILSQVIAICLFAAIYHKISKWVR